MSKADKLELPSAAETRKRRLWLEMVQWLRFELNSRFSLPLREREDVRHLEDMAATLVNSGELYDKQIQAQLEQIGKADSRQLLTALRTPVFVKAPPEAVMTAQDVIALYDSLAGINDAIEYGDDGYVRFGSANDADHFREVLAGIEARRNALLFKQPAGLPETLREAE
jgi:hypothetical protein